MKDKFNLSQMSQEYLDILKELGNIGAGNATTALAQLLQCKVDMQVPKVKVLDFSELGATMGGEENVMAAIFLNVEGDINGSMMFLQEIDSAKHVIEKMMGEKVEDDFSEMQVSALQEIGNIIAGSYLNSLAKLTNLSIIPSVPSLSIDMAGAILSVPAIEFGMISDRILLIETQFFNEIEIDGYFVLIPDMESYEVILRSLGVQ